MRFLLRFTLIFSFIIFFVQLAAGAENETGTITGVVIDKKSKEPLIGAIITVIETNTGAAADHEGSFELKDLQPGTYSVQVKGIGYHLQTFQNVEVRAAQSSRLNVEMEEDAIRLGEAVVYGRRKTGSDLAVISSVKSSQMVVSGISAQQIAKTQDRDASEVVKRIPGISVIENRFIIARGLAQRYNNVWVNNNAVPSSEADSRAFSFDMIPSGQIENIMIVKSPAPELPADFSGGFIKIETKSVPEENSLQVSYGININTMTHFRDFKHAQGSSTDFLGFDNGFRDMQSVVPNQRIDSRDKELVTDVTANGFNNNWKIQTFKPIADQRFSMMLNRFSKLENGGQLGVIAALNYSYSYLTYTNMTNSRFGIYNKTDDSPLYLYKYEDDQYVKTARTGGMLNLIWMLSHKHKLELRNIFNQQGRDRYTYRDGWQNISSMYEQQKEEYLYSSRGTYTGQLSGVHTLSQNSKMDWTTGYSYANKNQPDRRQIDRQEDFDRFSVESIIRDFNRLDENTLSAGVNYDHDFQFGSFTPSLKTGGYTEYRSREYNTRYFLYKTNRRNLPEGFIYRDVATEMMLPEYFAADKFHISDASDKTNDYYGENLLASGYLGLNVPIGKFKVYAGVRYENNTMSLTNNTSIVKDDTETFDYKSADFFPSVNATYNINKKNLLRFAYGKSINRQEFREVSPSIYYDFDLFSFVRGNKELQQAYIQNFDFRYEIYPSDGEMISLALFYKRFTNPIEWTFIDGGGTYIYTFENAKQADSYGIELDAKKNLDFIGLPYFSILFNGALIHSEVMFDENSLEHNRPMQGQSPYLINTGLFYQREKLGAGVMYNIIGKRIVGIGRNDNSQGGSVDNNVPDMYEMPRHVLDLSLSYKPGKHVELNAGVRDILAAPYVYKQFPEFVNGGGKVSQREQTTKEYKPGQNFSVSIKLTM